MVGRLHEEKQSESFFALSSYSCSNFTYTPPIQQHITFSGLFLTISSIVIDNQHKNAVLRVYNRPVFEKFHFSPPYDVTMTSNYVTGGNAQGRQSAPINFYHPK